jgi:hypothetical protein
MSMTNSMSIGQWSNITPSAGGNLGINVGPQGQGQGSQDPLSDLKEINMMQSNVHGKMKSRHKLKRLDQLKFYASGKFKSPRGLGNLVESNILSLEESLQK